MMTPRRPQPRTPALAALTLGAAACFPPAAPVPGTTGTTTAGDSGGGTVDWPAGPCALDPPNPSALLLTTTDFATGAVSVVDLATGAITPDVALASTDAIPYALGDRAVIVNRYQFDYLDVLAPDQGWASLAEIALDDPSVPSTNPHAVAAGPDGTWFVTFFGLPAIAVLDPSAPPAQAWIDRISLAPVADADGNPEASFAIACGDVLLVSLGRLDDGAGFAPRGEDRMVAVDMTARALLPGHVPLLGSFLKQVRRDPTDPEGRHLLLLTTGIERLDPASGALSWAVPDTAFAAAGLDDRLLPQSFDVSADGTVAYLAAYTPDFSEVRLYRVGLDGAAPAVPEPFAGDLASVERTLELVGDTLWVGSTRAGARGLWRFDVSTDPPTVFDGPRTVGLPPYSLTTLP